MHFLKITPSLKRRHSDDGETMRGSGERGTEGVSELERENEREKKREGRRRNRFIPLDWEKNKSLWEKQWVSRCNATIFLFHMIGLLITVMNHKVVFAEPLEIGRINKSRWWAADKGLPDSKLRAKRPRRERRWRWRWGGWGAVSETFSWRLATPPFTPNLSVCLGALFTSLFAHLFIRRLSS